MLATLGYSSMDAFVADTVPEKIRSTTSAVSNESIPALSESELFRRAKELGKANKPFKSYIGMGYHNAVVPPVILRNVRPFNLPIASVEPERAAVIIRSWRAPRGTHLIRRTSLRSPRVCGEVS